MAENSPKLSYVVTNAINKMIDVIKSGQRPSTVIEMSNQDITNFFDEDQKFWLTLTSLDWDK